MILKYSNSTTVNAAETIARGGVIAFRTDTFYGLGADPFNVGALQRIKQLKGREANKPILVVISDLDPIKRFISERSRTFDRLGKRFWPGALTLIGAAAKAVPDEVTAGTGTIGIRLPDDDKVRALVRACGGALTATSANPSGSDPARTAAEVEAYFGAGVDFIVDSGKSRGDLPSTVVDAGGAETKLIREGAVPWGEIQAMLACEKIELQNRER